MKNCFWVFVMICFQPILTLGVKTMNNPYQEHQIFDMVKMTLVQVLGCDPKEVTADAALVNDLNADSLDFVEFRHMLERQLGIALPQKSVLEHLAVAVGGEDRIYEKGQITQFAASVLHHSPFHYGDGQVETGMLPYEIMNVTTAWNWASCCYALFNHLPDRCPSCNAVEAKLSPAGKAICAGCVSSFFSMRQKQRI
jgi:acyl carrier protein